MHISNAFGLAVSLKLAVLIVPSVFLYVSEFQDIRRWGLDKTPLHKM